MSQHPYMELMNGSHAETFNGPAHRVQAWMEQSISANLRVSAASGTAPTLDVVIQDSWDGVNWRTWMTLAQLTAPGESDAVAASTPGRFIRAQVTIGGNRASFDFIVDLAGLVIARAFKVEHPARTRP